MKNIGYIIGSLEAMLGSVILCRISILGKILPNLEFYTRFDEPSFPVATTIGVILMVAGIAQIVYFCFKKD